MILAAVLTFGQLLYCAQSLQPAADLAARELARTPLPATSTFYEALQDPGVRGRVFDERYLVLTIDTAIPEQMGSLPGSNQITFNGGYRIADFPLGDSTTVPAFYLRRDHSGHDNRRYEQLGNRDSGDAISGAVFTDPNPKPNPPYPPASGYLVRIPVLQYPPIQPGPVPAIESGAKQVGWVPVIEEIQSSSASNPVPPESSSSFPVSSPQRGIVALRINYPYQSASMSGFRPPSDGTSLPGPRPRPPPRFPSRGQRFCRRRRTSENR